MVDIRHRHSGRVLLHVAAETLAGADLSTLCLCEANFRGMDLCGARLWRANLLNADLSGANLCGCFLLGAVLWGADLTGTSFDSATHWPDGFVPPDPPTDTPFPGMAARSSQDPR